MTSDSSLWEEMLPLFLGKKEGNEGRRAHFFLLILGQMHILTVIRRENQFTSKFYFIKIHTYAITGNERELCVF